MKRDALINVKMIIYIDLNQMVLVLKIVQKVQYITKKANYVE